MGSAHSISFSSSAIKGSFFGAWLEHRRSRCATLKLWLPVSTFAPQGIH
jgi:hypothetical protein